MKYDPTKTKTLIRSYKARLRRLISEFWNDVHPKIIQSIDKHQKRLIKNKIKTLSAVTEIENILHESDYNLIQRKLKSTIRNFNNQIYFKGSERASRDLKRVNIDFTFDMYPRDFEAIEVLVDHNFAEMKNTTVYMKKELLRVISEGMLQGQGIPEMSRSMRDRINVVKHKADMIARTETIRCYNQAAVNQYKKVGVTKWRWITAFDDRTCDICAGLDGYIFKMGEPQPPAHPNCRCSVAPVVERNK